MCVGGGGGGTDREKEREREREREEGKEYGRKKQMERKIEDNSPAQTNVCIK